jgi:cyclohexyl-isocyanide hydratase
MTSIPLDTHLTIGGLIYPNMDQCDFTGPFEALARVPNSHFVTIWKDKNPVRDLAGMLLMADTTIAEAPQLDVLLVPGGYRLSINAGGADALRSCLPADLLLEEIRGASPH